MVNVVSYLDTYVQGEFLVWVYEEVKNILLSFSTDEMVDLVSCLPLESDLDEYNRGLFLK